MIAGMPIVSLHRVGADGSISLVSANVPYANLQWTRRMSSCGQFELQLACPMPAPWPGRYLVAAQGLPEVGVVEKVAASESPDGTDAALSGRFAECLWDRYRFRERGGTARGANWRQAVTAALAAWHMGDLPPLSMGAGTEEASGSSYALSGGAGDSAMETVYGCAHANGAYPLVSYDRDADPGRLSVRIVDGLDRTRAQSERPLAVFSLAFGSASEVSYSGDYSVSCSEVAAYAEKDVDQATVAVSRTLPVPGFDPATQWEARAYEDVGSLIDQDAEPTAALVDAEGALRAYDHMPQLAIDGTVSGEGYGEWWDLGDLCEAEMPSLGLVASERIEEVRIVAKQSGVTVEATLGTKQISKLARAMRR